MSTVTQKERATRASKIRAGLKHPVIDSDGHTIELTAVYLDYLKQVAGPEVVKRFMTNQRTGGWYGLSPSERLDQRRFRPASWGLPAKNTLDRATAMLPRLLRARLDDIGLDFSIIYSSFALQLVREPNDELRRSCCRALNTMFADIYGEQRDRMTPAATIPTNTPQEALDELDYAVKTLGLKAMFVNSNVKRSIPAAGEAAAGYATWIDPLCMDGPYDYDPVWAKCMELKVAVTSHTPGMGWGSRVTTNHYIYNHVGAFAASGEAFAKAVVLGGVSKRFPDLNFAFLEGGVGWASELYAGLIGHCSKRNPTRIGNYDPKNIDLEQLADLCAEYGGSMFKGRPDPGDPDFGRTPNQWTWGDDNLIAHELDNLGIKKAEDLRQLFEPHFYFGCEADDPLVALGFDARFNPFGARLKAIFSSDIGHWDVPDVTRVLDEAYELVERELLDEKDFRDFMFAYPATLHAGMNPDFFKGTVVEADVQKLLKSG